ncbi:MAG: pantoate--beta-alanine ligase [Steroidobacteraceae bacterium]|jgi:pantoate--beta-alanine ligase
MDILTRSASLRDRLKVWREAGNKVALVPTAGTLHKGHLSLVAEAQERAERVVVSVFAGLNERDVSRSEADRDLLQKVGPDILFAPPVQELYPFGTDLSASVDVPQLGKLLEGAHQPGHIAEGLTLLLKLLNLVGPDFAVFGERDYQQLVSVRQMVNDLFIPVEIVSCQTLRETDGLALATGNRLLTAAQRAAAPLLYATLSQVAKRIDAGDRDYAALEKNALEALSAGGFRPEYLVIRQSADLAPARPAARDLVVLAAAQLGAVRLTDNLRVRVIDRY